MAEIAAARPSALTLESACRDIRRTLKFVPTIAEMLKLLRKHRERWEDRRVLACAENIGKTQQELRAALADSIA